MTTLPNKLSALIRVALDDLEKCENDGRYRINMDIWHDPDPAISVCYVCLAGAVMAQSLKLAPSKSRAPSMFPENQSKLYALNGIRSGHIYGPLLEMGVGVSPDSMPEKLRKFSVTSYSRSPTQFKSDLRALADELEQYGF